MPETHEEVVKVWIEPGCIVCDSCENDSPKVFDVQEDTCVIRPEAMDAEFTKPLTPSIITAAEGCPVDVIKYETVEVEGPEPWAGEEEEAAVGAGAGGGAGGNGAAKKGGWSPPEGPPDPKWAGLLRDAHVTDGRSAGGPRVTMRPAAKAPVEAVAATLERDAPPDALAAVAVGAGLTRPRPSVAERVKQKGAKAATMTRRGFALTLAVAWGGLAATAFVFGGALQSFMIPKITKEPPSKFKAGRLADFGEVGVYEQHKDKNVWIVHLSDGKLVALSTICTHLGCIPNWLANDAKFKCPCHGSGFYMNGVNFEGPAPRPLERHKISLDGDTVLVDKAFKYREELGQWESQESFVMV